MPHASPARAGAGSLSHSSPQHHHAAPSDNYTLDVSDREIGQVLDLLRLDRPDFLPSVFESRNSNKSLPRNHTLALNILVDILLNGATPTSGLRPGSPSFLGDTSSGDLHPEYDPDSPLSRVRNMLSWCASCWADRDAQEDELKKSRRGIDPSSLLKLVSFIDAEGTGTVNVKALADLFTNVRRATSLREMDAASLAAVDDLLSFLKKRSILVPAFCESLADASGVIPVPRLRDFFLKDLLAPPSRCDAALSALRPHPSATSVTVQSLAADLRKADGLLRKGEMEASRKARQEAKLLQATQAARKEQSAVERLLERRDLEQIAAYLDPTGVGEVPIDDLMNSFRKARRNVASEPVRRAGAELMRELEQFLFDERWTLIKWFNCMSSTFRRQHKDDSDDEDDEDAQWYPGGVKPDKVDLHSVEPTRKISALELKKGLQHLGCGFDETEIGYILRFMDPNGDGDLTYPEVKDAFRKLHGKTDAEKFEECVGLILIRIEDFMKEKGLRILAFFKDLDREDTGLIPVPALIDALKRLTAPNGKLDSLLNKREAGNVAEQARLVQAELAAASRRKLIDDAAAAGVVTVLEHLEHFLKEKGLTVATLCKLIDPANKGMITGAELVDNISKLMQASGASQIALQKARQREAEKLAIIEARRSRAKDMQEKMQDMESQGALACVVNLEAFIRKNCMRTVDLFVKIGKGDQSSVTAEELRNGMKKCGLKMKRKDVVLFVRYVDLSGKGEIKLEDLEAAMRDFRRYNWEKDAIKRLVSTSGAPLPLRCRDFMSLWRPSEVGPDGTTYYVNGADVCAGLMRMRGDGDDFLWSQYEPPVPVTLNTDSTSSRPGTKGSSRGGGTLRSTSRGGGTSRPMTRESDRANAGGAVSPLGGVATSVISEMEGMFAESSGEIFMGSSWANISSVQQGSGGVGLPAIVARSGGVDKKTLRLRKELREKVKSKTFKALHIGVPVSFSLNR